MKREIKFRGKRIDNGEWVYGHYYSFIAARKTIASIMGIGKDTSTYMVDPETVGQYTGLTDRKGAEIYEGDIVEFEDMGEEGYEYKEGYDFTNRAVVVFENGRYTLDKFMDDNSGIMEELNDHEETWSVIQGSIVIGSIYDNPDLLEGVYE